MTVHGYILPQAPVYTYISLAHSCLVYDQAQTVKAKVTYGS